MEWDTPASNRGLRRPSGQEDSVEIAILRSSCFLWVFIGCDNLPVRVIALWQVAGRVLNASATKLPGWPTS